MTSVYVAGVSMTPFGDHRTVSLKALAAQAVRDALIDADCAAKDIEAAWFANAAQGAVDGQHTVRGQVALRSLGFDGVPITNVENACASASTALQAAMHAVAAQDVDIALVIGAEKLITKSKETSLAVFNAGFDVAAVDEQLACLRDLGGDLPEGNAGQRSVFMEVYAALARQHMRLFGSTSEDLAAVSAKNHTHSVHNPLAHYRRPFSIAEVLAARMVAFPLTLPMCCPVSDGAAAAIICSDAGLRRLGNSMRAIRVDACVLGSGAAREADDYDQHIGRRTALKAYERAGIGPEDIDVAEVHDAAAIGEVIQVENLGLAPRGEGGSAARMGVTALGGKCPVNPSGGLQAKGHPIGATGLAQVFELVSQLRGEAGARQVDGATVAVSENGGGFIGFEEASCVVTVLSR